ncbi:hypothetical protein [Thalassomonas actiniarum]|uniref:Uncharacterized protein n=1 Tax=Thalassomonas actiniarum TaxID=485447 RepID=A0AAE9YRJ0_9GAMM|nr:hypothetical protein [Thalassomonas actiniarum]WDD99387.1 hypothetical protein SG35_001475 [Thalassomonas actiniarum]
MSVIKRFSEQTNQDACKQTSIIGKSILALCFIAFIAAVGIQFITLTPKQDYKVQISIENYQPMMMQEKVVINEQLITQGTQVDKDQAVAKLGIVDLGEQQSESHYLRAEKAGYYFQSPAGSKIIPAHQPIGYLLNNNSSDEYLFWLQEHPKNPLKAGADVTIKLGEQSITGRISMIFGPFTKDKGQKISIRLNEARDLSLMSPGSKLILSVKEHPKTLAQLLS